MTSEDNQRYDEIIRQANDSLYKDAGNKIGHILYSFIAAIRTVNEIDPDNPEIPALVTMLFISNLKQRTGIDLTEHLSKFDNLGFDDVTALSISQRIPGYCEILDRKSGGATDAEISEHIRRYWNERKI